MLEKHYGSSVHHDISDIVIENPAMMHFKDKLKENKQTTADIIPARVFKFKSLGPCSDPIRRPLRGLSLRIPRPLK